MAQYELSWRDYYRVIRKRKWFVLAVFLSVTLAGYLYSRKEVPVYEAVTTVRIYARQPIASMSQGGITFWGARSTLESEIQLIKSDRVLEKVVKELGWVNGTADELQLRQATASLRKKIIAERVDNTDLVQIKARDSDPGQAVKMSIEVAYSYIEDNWQRKVNEAETTR